MTKFLVFLGIIGFAFAVSATALAAAGSVEDCKEELTQYPGNEPNPECSESQLVTQAGIPDLADTSKTTADRHANTNHGAEDIIGRIISKSQEDAKSVEKSKATK